MPKSNEPKEASQELVLREFPPLGKYRVRLVKREGKEILDIREYMNADGFEGFTRRGVRLSMVDLKALNELIESILKK